ncbi:hypothetical protein TWF696_008584 [Orbilia brochopaga]|uniref:Peptidase S8/S53 domain-containing protein n=1 Tax=Orbilia brochopaga TaxID=3140254 RepID=A0AAV9UJP1_9PEZI
MLFTKLGVVLLLPIYAVAVRRKDPVHPSLRTNTQTDRRELCLLSQFHDVKHPFGFKIGKPCTYYTSSPEGAGVVVYLLDSGVNLEHEDFDHLRKANSKPKYLYFDGKDLNPDDDDTRLLEDNYLEPDNTHGTQALSRICGNKYGVAKLVTPVIVKVTDKEGKISTESVVKGLQIVADDINKRALEAKTIAKDPKLKDKAAESSKTRYIVNISIATRFSTMGKTNPDTIQKQKYISLMRLLSKKDDVLVIAAAGGDEDGDPDVSGPHPYILGENESKYPNLIIVGGVNTVTGQLYQAQPGEWVKVFAPVTNIMVAKGKGGEYGEITGAFLAAPAITGVLAVLFSTYQYTASEAKEELYKLAYPRNYNDDDTPEQGRSSKNVYPPVVYNGLGQPPGLNAKSPSSSRRPGNKQESGRKPNRVNFIPPVPESAIVENCDDEFFDKVKREEASPNGVSRNETATRACVAPQRAPSTPALTFEYVYNATFCKVCIEADGLTPIDGVVWIPKDCPCRPEDIPA